MTWLKRKEQKSLDRQEEKRRMGIKNKPKGNNCIINPDKRQRFIDAVKKALE